MNNVFNTNNPTAIMATINDDIQKLHRQLDENNEDENNEDENNEETLRPALSTITLELTKIELVHLRDLLSIKLPPHLYKTVSQSLAEKEGRPLTETKLWNKVGYACANSGIPLNEAAPDFVIGLVNLPEMKVFEISSNPIDPQEIGENDGDGTNPFNKDA